MALWGASMDPTEIKFFIDEAADHGTSVLCAAVRHGKPYWKTFFEQGWRKKVSPKKSVKREFLETLPFASDSAVAIAAFEAYFKAMKPLQVDAALASKAREESIFRLWLRAGIEAPERAVVVGALLNTARRCGGDLNPIVTTKLGANGNEVGVPLMEHLIRMGGFTSEAISADLSKQVSLLIDHGVCPGPSELDEVMKLRQFNVSRMYVEDFIQRGVATLGDFLRCRHIEGVNQDTVAFLESEMARRTIHETALAHAQCTAQAVRPL